MEIVRIKAIEELNSLRMEGIKEIFNSGLSAKVISGKFSWPIFFSYWEIALQFPWNALWLAVDETDEDTVYGVFGGACSLDIITGSRLAYKLCSGISKEIATEEAGWELFEAFLEWAIKEQEVIRICVQRIFYKDSTFDEYLDMHLKELGFRVTGCEYCLEL